MMEMVAQKLRQMGGTVELVDVGEQEVSARATFTAVAVGCEVFAEACYRWVDISNREGSVTDASKRLQNNSEPHLDPH